MIHHVSLGTNDTARAKRFYDAVLSIVGLAPMISTGEGLAYGSGTFHFSVQAPIDSKSATVGNGTHIAFAVEERGMVDRFYSAAVEHLNRCSSGSRRNSKLRWLACSAQGACPG